MIRPLSDYCIAAKITYSQHRLKVMIYLVFLNTKIECLHLKVWNVLLNSSWTSWYKFYAYHVSFLFIFFVVIRISLPIILLFWTQPSLGHFTECSGVKFHVFTRSDSLPSSDLISSFLYAACFSRLFQGVDSLWCGPFRLHWKQRTWGTDR